MLFRSVVNAKRCLEIRENPKITKQFFYSRLRYCSETKYCLLLLRMARMEGIRT